MKEDMKKRQYEIYQDIMAFLDVELPTAGWQVVKLEYDDDQITIVDRLWGDKRENFVRAFLGLPTVQHDRKVADDLIREIQEKANKK